MGFLRTVLRSDRCHRHTRGSMQSLLSRATSRVSYAAWSWSKRRASAMVLMADPLLPSWCGNSFVPNSV